MKELLDFISHSFLNDFYTICSLDYNFIMIPVILVKLFIKSVLFSMPIWIPLRLALAGINRKREEE